MLDSPLINSKENSSETVFSRAGAVELASVMLATFSPMFDNIANYMKTRDETLDKHGKKLKGHKKLLKGHEGRLNGCEGQMKGYEERLKRLEGSTFRGRQVVEVAESATRAAKRRSPAAARRKGRAARRARKPRQPAPRKQLNDEQSALLLRVALAHLKPNTYRGAIGAAEEWEAIVANELLPVPVNGRKWPLEGKQTFEVALELTRETRVAARYAPHPRRRGPAAPQQTPRSRKLSFPAAAANASGDGASAGSFGAEAEASANDGDLGVSLFCLEPEDPK